MRSSFLFFANDSKGRRWGLFVDNEVVKFVPQVGSGFLTQREAIKNEFEIDLELFENVCVGQFKNILNEHVAFKHRTSRRA